MRKLLAVLTAIACLTAPAAALADAGTEGETLLYNGDFSTYAESAQLPAGWDLAAYATELTDVSVSEDEAMGTVVTVQNLDHNDARICQSVTVEPDSCYLLTGWIRTEGVSGGTGANLSIDNYALDGTYCYSENLFGTEDWREVHLFLRTGPEQNSITVALRLGGYGTTASGTASFANVGLYPAADAGDQAIVDLMSSNGTISGYGDETDVSGGALTGDGAIFALVLAAFFLSAGAYALLYRRSLRYEKGLTEKGASLRALFAVLAVALACRVILSLIFFGHPTDINCFMAWGEAVRNLGMGGFYTSGMFADYPPGYMYVCGLLSWICRLLGISYGSNAMALVFKLPATAADLVSAYLLYRVALKNRVPESFALVLAGVLALNPVLLFVSGAWGQIDSLLTLLLVTSCLLLQRGKRIPAGAVYGLAILMKPQALMLGPLLAAAFIADIFGKNWKKKLLETLAAVLAAVLVLLGLALPFQGSQPWYWLVEKYASTATSYPYASIEAFNFASLIGGNWKHATETRVLGLPYNLFGIACIALSVAFSLYLYLRGRRRGPGALYLSGGVMIQLIFTFGHYMHERYMIPALFLLLMAYVYERDRRLLLAFGGITLASLLNVTSAMYVVNHVSARGNFYLGLTAVGSAMTVLFCGYLVYIAVKILIREEALSPLPLPKETAAKTPAGRGVQPLLLTQTDNALRYTRRELLCVLGVTLVYGVVALTNLGSLQSPESYWETDTPGESVTAVFDGPVHVASYWVHGNIGTGGTLLVQAADYEGTFQQTYDDMFRWKPAAADFTTDRVTLSLYSGAVKINEVAFFDESGVQIPIRQVQTAGGGEALLDEQDTVPEIPSYYNGMYFDELYHGRTAYEHLHNLTPYENSHPPLGKIFIMLGIAVFGMCPFGWRVAGALFGVAMLPLFYAFGKRILKDTKYAFLAMGLFALDFMHFTQTRIATIDVYAVFFILLMYYYMYQYICMNFFTDGLKRTLKPLALAGLFFGVGAACKWTCIYAGAGLAVLLACSLLARYREYAAVNASGSRAQRAKVADFWTLTVKTLLWCCVFYIAVPVTVYYLSYLPYYLYEGSQSAGYGITDTWKTLWKYQEFMYSYHSNLNATHPYQSTWYTWPLTLKPMWYYFNSQAGGRFVSTMSASGNPAVWWVCSFGTLALLGLRISGRIKPDKALQVLCVGVLANYLPWVLVTRCTFIYHFFATVPFLILSAAYALKTLEEKDRGTAFVKWVWLGMAALFFILLYPGLSGLAVSPEWAAFLKNLPGGKLMYGA